MQFNLVNDQELVFSVHGIYDCSVWSANRPVALPHFLGILLCVTVLGVTPGLLAITGSAVICL